VTTFVGIDLAWQSDKNHTGIAAFRGDASGASCLVSSGVSSLAGVRAFLEEHAVGDAVVAIDAPLVIENSAGQRACEREVTRRFGRFHAGAHPSNLTLHPEAGGVLLARSLVASGYRHVPDDFVAEAGGRWLFEVYPHPAHVVLFGRDRIIKYKKGPVAQRRAGLGELRDALRDRLYVGSAFRNEGALAALLAVDAGALAGRALKHHEDRLDAVLCAYLAFHLWRFGWKRSERIGDLRTGYIVVPTVALP
jgi:predicted RNase H-like nuclease